MPRREDGSWFNPILDSPTTDRERALVLFHQSSRLLAPHGRGQSKISQNIKDALLAAIALGRHLEQVDLIEILKSREPLNDEECSDAA